MHGYLKMTMKIYETLEKYDLKPDARIQQRVMDHKKITNNRNKLLEEQRKKAEQKAKKEKKAQGVVASSVSGSMALTISPGAVRASNVTQFRATEFSQQQTMNYSIINDRDAKSSYRDA